MEITDKLFGHYIDEPVIEYTLVNDSGMSVSCLNYGCIITKILSLTVVETLKMSCLDLSNSLII